ncbi:TspO/MBR family protein [Aspergillus candidus]|uniref:Peripheral-type benzodiazepine receptor n=1 Tax=Aspergillus candidus TaxID=41067 RepID=A0A2I2EZP6_ASPCN|nr:peripheral-type benzodiazepine receptor [Aspergillus candidus]PLB33853.1 peripheral-type benzodiazepine receptor [Aspergillus candidus]
MPWSTSLPQGILSSPLLSIGTPTASGLLVGYLVNRGGRTKGIYHSLKQPPYHPPAWLFPPVWSLLYTSMGYAAYHANVTTFDDSWQPLYGAQLALNYLWMPLFFGLRKPAWALADLTLLGGTVTSLMSGWWETDRTAFWFMVPYAAWLGYAAYLNVGVGVLNKWRIPGGQKKGE